MFPQELFLDGYSLWSPRASALSRHFAQQVAHLALNQSCSTHTHTLTRNSQVPHTGVETLHCWATGPGQQRPILSLRARPKQRKDAAGGPL